MLCNPVPIGTFPCRPPLLTPVPGAGAQDEAGGEGGTDPSPGAAALPYQQTALASLNMPMLASGTAARFVL